MVTYSPHPVFVDGVRLDSAAWGIDVKTRSMAALRSGDVTVPGVDGVAASLNDDLEQAQMSLSMWVLGTDDNGVVPSGSTGMATCNANMDALSHLFGTRWRLLDVQETWDASGTLRQAWCKVTDTIQPVIRAGGYARFTVNLNIPAGVRQDVSTADWSQTNPTSTVQYEVTTLRGATAPVDDAVIVVTGPANNPKVSDGATGAYVQLNQVLASGQTWRINVGTWASRYGSGLSFASTDTAGSDGQPYTVYGGGNARFLRLTPTLSGGLRRIYVSLTAAGTTSATAVAVRARRKYLL